VVHHVTEKGSGPFLFGCNSAWVRGVERLHRLPAHAGVPQYRWGVFLNDFGQFIHGRGGWAERAADLGWDTLALFGCHPTRPLDHLNGAGLLWRISGGKISSMETDRDQRGAAHHP
jgi:hypothetical protein